MKRERRVLVVDDEPDIRELLELTLARMGLGVDSAGSIAEAKNRKSALREPCNPEPARPTSPVTCSRL